MEIATNEKQLGDMILNFPMNVVCGKLGCKLKDLQNKIKSSEYLMNIYKSPNRKTRVNKYKEKNPVATKSEVQIFNTKLNKAGAKRLCSRVIKMALIDKDEYFFKSGAYVVFDGMLENTYELSDYLKFMGLKVGEIRALHV